MNPETFPAFYEAIHGHRPFVWQVELLRRVVEKGWPETIAMPTSSGKTSAIDVAVFHLALEAGKSALERQSSLRMFFIVDRRVVVDEAFIHAGTIAEQLIKSTDQTVREVAERLSTFGGELPLQVSRMRGGMLRDNGWADEPNQPTVCLSTVDQVGSRLLFRGYQVGERSRSVHAGLVGNDSLLILDEAHLSNAFHQTLESVKSQYAQRADKLPARAPMIVKMSATTSGAGVFELDEKWIEADAATLGARLRASKPAELRETKKKFEEELAGAAKELAAEIKNGVVGVVANTVDSARDVFGRLSGDKVLLIGRNRPWCADQLWSKYGERIKAQKGRTTEGLLYVVATQTVEVGANIDFDALVSESAPLDSLRQRFGRLNRLGRPGTARAVIVLRPKEDHVYGDATKRTWAFLKAHKPVDFGVLEMNALVNGLSSEELKALCSTVTEAPMLFPGHLEWWVQTSPAPEPDPDVAPFLHGTGATEAADVQIVWREDLLMDNQGDWAELVELMPPVRREALGLPVRAVRHWLKQQRDQEVTDMEGAQPEPLKEEKKGDGRPVVLWRSRGAETVDSVNPGDTIVVPSSYGGADEFGWNANSDFTGDIADPINKEEASQGLRRRCVRLDIAARTDMELAALVAGFRLRKEREPQVEAEIIERVKQAGLKNKDAKVDWSRRVVFFAREPQAARSVHPESQETDETDDSSLTSSQSLKAHTAGVVEHAKTFAAGCGISPELAGDVVLAARLHDWGKCDERFQTWLSGTRFTGVEYLAKSPGNRSMAESQKLKRMAGYPDQARHEAASVTAAMGSGLLTDAHDPELVIYLIGTHHGCGRPFFPVWKDEPGFLVLVEAEGKSFEASSGSELARIDSGWVDRFALLNQRYGYWGLAYLEAILRRADCMQSRKEEQGAAN